MRKCILLMFVSMVALTSCDKKEKAENPFFAEWDTPYGMPPFGDIKPEHYKPAYEEAIRQHNAEIEAIVSNTEAPNFENVILALDNAGEMLSRVGGAFGMVNSAESTEELRAIQREMTPVLTAHSDNINMNPRLFEKVKAVYDNQANLNLTPLQVRLLEKKYRSFVRSGALLDDVQKEELRKINGELASASVKFGNNLLQEQKKFQLVLTRDDIKGIPAGVRDAAAELAKQAGLTDQFVFTIDNASRIPFLTYADRRDLREQIYKAYIGQGNHDDELDTKGLVNEMARLRLERAKLLGYNSFAEFTLEQRMAKTPENVYSLLDDLWTPALAGAENELEAMREIKARETDEADFEGWDWWYYAEKLRKEKYDLNEEMLRPYFSLPKVQAGIFELCNRLYGITFRPVTVPVYHHECVTFEVQDKDQTHLGILLMDFHPRAGKNSGAWCGAYRMRDFDANGKKVADPIVYIVCNFTRSTGNTPALLTLDETETFFHEFGHALHNLFGMAPYKGLRRTEQDFVELPSQIMENWAFEPEMLKRYAVHYSTGEIIPDNLIEKIQNSAYFNQGFVMTEYLAASLSDMDIHNIRTYSTIDVNEYEREVLNVRRGLISQIAPRYRFPYFKHIFSGGYSAGYYGYKWAEVLDKDAYEAFAETGDIFNPDMAARFRNEVLSKGGTADGMVLYTNFRGKEPSRDYLLYASGLKERPQEEKPVVPEIVDAIDE